jgi:hypothetical protein
MKTQAQFLDLYRIGLGTLSAQAKSLNDLATLQTRMFTWQLEQQKRTLDFWTAVWGATRRR